MRAGAVQLNASEDADRNLATADRLVREAVRDGAELVLLPEKWTVFGTGRAPRAPAPSRWTGRRSRWARGIARELGIDLVAGSIVERVPGAEKLSNTSIHFGPDGEQRALYRKIHMFDVEVDGAVYAESEHEQPGDEVVVSKLAVRRRARHEHLLRPPVPGAVQDAGRARRARWCACRPRSRSRPRVTTGRS